MHCAHRYRTDIMYTVYECTDSPKFTMKLTEIYRYMATHDSHSKFWACDAELTELIVCRKSRFLLENRPRVPPYRTVSCSWVSCMAACGGCGAAASHVEICRPWYRLLGSAPRAATRVANGWRRTGRPVTRRLREEFRRRGLRKNRPTGGSTWQLTPGAS